MNSEEFVVADAEKYLYYCKDCKTWKVAEDLSLYAAKDPEAIRKRQFGIKTVEEWGEIPYASGMDFEDDYRLLQKRMHKCPKCRKGMIRYTEGDLDDPVFADLPCPKCGAPLESSGYIMWD